MSRYMIRVYLRYHAHRFGDYWRQEGRTFIKDIVSAKLAVRLSALFALFMIMAFIVNGNVYYWQVAFFFSFYALLAHIWRDYRIGRHIGWNRKKKKELAHD